MRHLLHLVLTLTVIAGTGILWITYVPSAASFLDRVGVAGFLRVEPAQAEKSGGRGGWGGGGPTQVVTATVTDAETSDVVEAIGDGEALRSAILRTEVGGEVVEVNHTTGGRVKAGTVILQLSAEAERIEVERAELSLQDARDEVERMSSLQGTGSVSEVRLREARLALRTAELDLREATYELDRRSIRAPFDGEIGLIDIVVGDRMSAGEEVTSLTDRSEVLVDFRVPERAIGLLKLGMTFEARPLGFAGAPLEGTIRAVDGVVNRRSRTMRVQGKLDNSLDRLRVGMAFSVVLRFPGETLAAVNPLAVQWGSEGSFVWVVRDGTAQRVYVGIRQRDADRVLIAGDIAPGEKVVVEGVQSLRPGAEVAIAQEDASLRADVESQDRERENPT